MTPEESIDELLEQWRLSGVGLRPGVSDRKLSAFERRHGILLPRALRALWTRVDGMNTGDMDATRTRYWPLAQVVTVREALDSATFDEVAHRGYLVFADFLLWSHGYAVRPSGRSNGASPVAIVGGAFPIIVAASVEEFLRNQVKAGAGALKK